MLFYTRDATDDLTFSYEEFIEFLSLSVCVCAYVSKLIH